MHARFLRFFSSLASDRQPLGYDACLEDKYNTRVKFIGTFLCCFVHCSCAQWRRARCHTSGSYESTRTCWFRFHCVLLPSMFSVASICIVPLPPRTEDRSSPVAIPWCDQTMYCALSARPSPSADLSPCTGCYKLILLTLYGGPAAAVR